MFNHPEWISYHPNSIWNETNEKWDESDTVWRTVGVAPSRFIDIPGDIETRERGILPINLTGMFPRRWYSIVEFPSGRLEVGYYSNIIDLDTYVILEADRGEDCGKIIGNMSESEFESSALRLRDMKAEFEPKKILRRASSDDLNKLRQRKKIEVESLKQCKELVSARNLNMEILSCEYQWDMKKITFYFKSDRRIDFRDLLKELFKIFKIRIWMCAERRTNNDLIKKILG
ncbi:Psp1-like protein [Encephalitozoon hellem ATCC 50504]|uniref:Psp1 C-terminal domain-containing protein n=1 Tax=Encephalitozoon hellem TaxID=27973 RepID=A0A9Q9CAQ1_ENCHE|nr:Psp1-like protein [Encephalitozoon hellem ATCC 50504]AEI69224.1 Psp1-like protein [Encephalitozoon hellem ATCC 50504]UTX43453.1 Psp1 C-terminal domain-containing protein [Encephalitozoon hellem]WEL38918.1 putative signal peptidase-like protein [Encephalitozoon hellem]|eukprot:XP_003887507.1 Psp1-like protein [Encephalitozoon hellem ATCC 50504]